MLSDMTTSYDDVEVEVTTYPARTVERRERVRAQPLASAESMRDLEQRVHGEDLCEVGAHAGEHGVGKENIALDLLAQVLYRAGVGETELRPLLRERLKNASKGGGDWVAKDNRV